MYKTRVNTHAVHGSIEIFIQHKNINSNHCHCTLVKVRRDISDTHAHLNNNKHFNRPNIVEVSLTVTKNQP